MVHQLVIVVDHGRQPCEHAGWLFVPKVHAGDFPAVDTVETHACLGGDGTHEESDLGPRANEIPVSTRPDKLERVHCRPGASWSYLSDGHWILRHGHRRLPMHQYTILICFRP